MINIKRRQEKKRREEKRRKNNKDLFVFVYTNEDESINVLELKLLGIFNLI